MGRAEPAEHGHSLSADCRGRRDTLNYTYMYVSSLLVSCTCLLVSCTCIYTSLMVSPGFHTEGEALGSPSPPPQHEFPPRTLKDYDVHVIALKDEKMAVVLHTSDGNLGVVS